MFSLEDDDANELFITQESKENLLDKLQESEKSDLSGLLGIDSMDFASQCSSLRQGVQMHYSDISDDEAFENCSKMDCNQG